MDLPPGLQEALELPLADAILSRRSRRFGLGMTLPSGPLAHASDAEPIPLTELEEAVLVWLGTGVTGLALGDLPPDGLSWMHRWIGRSWPCSVNSHSTELFFTNDAGLHVVRLRGREPEPAAAAPAGPGEEMTRLFREARETLEEGRADLPTGEPGCSPSTPGTSTGPAPPSSSRSRTRPSSTSPSCSSTSTSGTASRWWTSSRAGRAAWSGGWRAGGWDAPRSRSSTSS